MMLGAVLWSRAGSLVAAYGAGTALGVGGGVLESMGSALLTDLYPDRRKLTLNASQVLFGLGAVSGPAVMSLLLPAGVSWRVVFAGVGLLAAVLLVLYTLATIPPPLPDEILTWPMVSMILRRPSFLVPCAAIFLYVLSESSVAIYANLYMQERLAAPEGWAIRSIAVVWLGMACGRLLCTLVPEDHPYEGVIALLFALSGAALAAQGFVRDWRLGFVLFALFGFFCSGTWPLIVGLAASRNPLYSGTAVGVTVAVGSLGVVAAPWVMNLLLLYVPVRLVFVLAAIPLILGVIVVLLPVEGARRSVDEIS
jgi:fucose permease